MSSIKVQNIRDYSGNTGFTLNANNTITVQGSRLSVDNLQINGTISGTGDGANSFLPSQSGNANSVLYTNGSSPSWGSAPAAGNITSMQVFTSSGTWNKPAGVRYIHVQVIGGGGGGSGHGESGGSGGYSEEIIDVQSISSVSVSVSGEANGTFIEVVVAMVDLLPLVVTFLLLVVMVQTEIINTLEVLVAQDLVVI